jgi:hypothetical protein
MTGKPTTTSAEPELAPSAERVLAALHRLGEATAAGTATEAGLGYSTTTPKLRALEKADLAEPFRDEDGRTLWRLTEAGRAHAAQPAGPGETSAPSADHRGVSDATDTTNTPDTANTDAAESHTEQPHVTDDADARDDVATEPAEAPKGRASTGNSRGAAHDEPGSGHDDTIDGQATTDGPQTVAGAGTDSIAVPSDSEAADARPATQAATELTAGAGDRRAPGTLRGAILDVLEANPNQGYKVSELCKLIDKANEGTGAKKASAGAVNNAALKLVGTGRAVLAVEKPVTFALARPDA